MKGLGFAFVTTVLAIPLIGQIVPTEAIDKLSIATAQTVLAFVAVFECLGIIVMFKIWRNDVSADREHAKQDREELVKLVSENSTVMAQHKDATHRQSNAVEGLQKSVDRFSDIIKKCEGK